MSMVPLQAKFAHCIGLLLCWIFEHEGWMVTFGESYDDDNTGHCKNSLHYLRLAQDLNLFVNGEIRNGDCPEWHEIGAYWKTLDKDCRWGGDFRGQSEGDFNHFSVEYQGRK